MFTRNINLFLCLLSALSGHVAASNEFDVLIFTQRWPKSICIVWKEESPSHSCALPKDNSEWTIHGLWPSQFHKLGPQFCDRNKPFNPAALAPLEKEMKEKWIDIEFGRESYGLWKHEWNKHGTCAAVLPPLNTEEKYFAKGLSLLKQYDMKNVLTSANILPGRNYAYRNLKNAVQRALGVHPMIVCKKDKKTGHSYLFEVRICLNKALELINCDGVYEYPTNCDPSANVVYPGSVSQDYNVVRV